RTTSKPTPATNTSGAALSYGPNLRPSQADLWRSDRACATPSRPVKHFAESKGMLHLAQIPEQAGHDAECLLRNRKQYVFVGRVLRTAGVGMGHPHGRQLEN